MGARATPAAAVPPGAGRVVVEVTDRQRRVRVGRAWLAGVVRRAVRLLGAAAAEVSVILVDDRRIARIHADWMGDPTPTDVITFPLPAGAGDDGVLRGDIVVSVETAARVAAEVGWTTRLETAYGAIHGLLHLVGHDDLSPGPRRAMRRRERTLMEALGLPAPPRPRRAPRAPPGKPRR
ncbi:MAG: rRNA maturation RNase YbeY [Planctomycetaceae bacterium]